MAHGILVATDDGLWNISHGEATAVEALAGHSVIALAREGDRTWALVDGRSLWATDEGHPWKTIASVPGLPATCLATTPAGLLVGTEEAHLLTLADEGLRTVAGFESVEGRATWYTPWGDPADVRSIAADDAATYVNVHVGGVIRSGDRGRTWAPTLDIEVDVHQVLADPLRPGLVLAAAAVGFGVSRDGGASWDFVTAGLHAHYLRAVTVAGETVLVSASTGPGGRRATLYRRPLDGSAPFERPRGGLPQWFGDNIDTACLVAAGATVIFGTSDGRVFSSLDAGATWSLAAKGLPEIHAVQLA